MADKLMLAVQYERHGSGPDGLQHVEVQIPVPKKDEVLIKVEAISINPMDWYIQRGKIPILPRKFPHIPGTDLAGEIVEVGSAVKNFATGSKVVAYLNHFIGGAFAEYVVAKESAMAKRPDEVSAAEGAGLPLAGLTALQALTGSAGIKLDGSGKMTNILITAASGGVGHYAVQLAKLGNTHITATCGSRNIDFVKSLGADEVIDYKTSEGAKLISPSGKEYDIVIHCATGIPWSTFEPQLSAKGKVIDLTPDFRSMLTIAFKKLTFSNKRLVMLFTSFKAEKLEYLLNLMKEGKLKTCIDSKYPLSKVEEGWAHGMSGHATGKIIIEA